MANQNIIKAITLTTFNSAAVIATYQAINGPNGLDHPCVVLKINNTSTTAITISYDGITDHEYLAANQFLVLDAQTNSNPKGNVCNFKRGTIVYVKGVAGVGTIALSGYYQPVI